MSHIKPNTPRARVTDHGVRRYVERVLGIVVDEELDDRAACIRLRALRGEQQVDVARVRARIADVGGVILSTGRTSGDAIAYPEGVKFRLVDCVVVTILACVPKVQPSGPVSQVPARPRTVLELGEAAA